MDIYGFVSVNCNRQLKSNEPFILASQASKAFYAIDQTKVGIWASSPYHSTLEKCQHQMILI